MTEIKEKALFYGVLVELPCSYSISTRKSKNRKDENSAYFTFITLLSRAVGQRHCAANRNVACQTRDGVHHRACVLRTKKSALRGLSFISNIKLLLLSNRQSGRTGLVILKMKATNASNTTIMVIIIVFMKINCLSSLPHRANINLLHYHRLTAPSLYDYPKVHSPRPAWNWSSVASYQNFMPLWRRKLIYRVIHRRNVATACTLAMQIHTNHVYDTVSLKWF